MIKYILILSLILFIKPSFTRINEVSSSSSSSSCRPGYSQSNTLMSCIAQSCTHKVQDNLHKFPVLFEYDQNTELAIYYVTYNADPNVRLPLYSVYLLDELNHKVNIDRNLLKGWYIHPCSELNDIQRNENEFFTQFGYQRGHLTPFKSISISAVSLLSTNLLINIAPQDGYTNNQWGKYQENKIYNLFHDRSGIVISGICKDLIGVKNDLSNQVEFKVPKCFWTLACFKNGGKTIVFGYYADNGYIDIKSKDDKTNGKPERQKQIMTLFSQKAIKDATGLGDSIAAAWQESSYLRESRKQLVDNIDINYPDVDDCKNTANLDSSFDLDYLDSLIITDKIKRLKSAKRQKTLNDEQKQTVNVYRKSLKQMKKDLKDNQRKTKQFERKNKK